MELLQNILAFLVAIGVLVTFHELGHFIVARIAGVRVVRFSIGFGTPLLSRRDRHGTEFVLAAIPLGGYVRMLDERDPLDALPGTAGREPNAAVAAIGRSYQAASVWWRMAIALGGPGANLILAAGLFAVMFSLGIAYYVPVTLEPEPGSPAAEAGVPAGAWIEAIDGHRVDNWEQVVSALAARLGESGEVVITARPQGSASRLDYRLAVEQWLRDADTPDFLAALGIRQANVVLDAIAPGSAAQRAGLRSGDIIVAADGEVLASWRDWVERVRAHPGRTMTLDVLRDGQMLHLEVTPDVRQGDQGAIGFLGVGPLLHEVTPGPLGALRMGVAESIDKSVLIVSIFGKMIVGDVSTKTLSGPLMIGAVAGESARSGMRAFIQVLAFLSVSLGVINLLPVPILDGGHIVFCLAELALGRPPSERVQTIGMQIGLVLVAGLMMLALYNDLARFL